MATSSKPTRPTTSKAGGSGRLKNYSSKSDLSSILESIRVNLAGSGATRVAFDYEDGYPVVITFDLMIHNHRCSFRLPARMASVEPLIIKAHQSANKGVPRGQALKDQVQRTAWANIRDWVSAQLALIQTGMVKGEEIYFPFLIQPETGLTYFEQFEQRLSLPAPRQPRTTISEA